MALLKKHTLLILFTALYLAFAFITFKDYGITFDERTEYYWGNEVFKHYSRNTKFSNTIAPIYEGEEKHQRHSPVLSEYYRIYPAVLSAINIRNTYEFFHLLNMLFASLLIIGSYILAYSVFKDQRYAILAPISIFLIPRFLGHIPANPKDMPFAVIYFFGLLAIYFSQNIKNEKLKILLLGLVFGIVQSSRIIGFTIYIVYVLWLLSESGHLDKVITKGTLNLKNLFTVLIQFVKENFLYLLFIFIIANFLMVLTWPYMGINYFKNFPQLFKTSTDFDYWDKPYLYMGNYISVETRPWHYLFVMISITTPLYMLFGFLLGIYYQFRGSKDKASYLIILTLVVNITLYLVLKPNIYNGLRHFLYLLPLIGYLSAIGYIKYFKSEDKKKRIVVICLVLSILGLGYRLVKLHPYEYVYFNETVNGLRGAKTRYETDYWGAGYKEASDWLYNSEYVKDFEASESGESNEKPTYFTCSNSFATEYYLNDKLTRTDVLNDADFMICDFTRLPDLYGKGTTIYEVGRDSAVFTEVRVRDFED